MKIASQKLAWVVGLAAVLGGLACAGAYQLWWHFRYYVVERTDYDPPERDDAEKLTDDRIEDKVNLFDASLIDSRPLGDWQVNASAAVVQLDCPMVRPDSQGDLLVLRSSYADAIREAKAQAELLPSANLLDGAAKQFDDGLYAALELACYDGRLGLAPAVPEFVRALFGKLPQGSPARPFLAAALELSGHEVALAADQAAKKAAWLAEFQSDQTQSKPIGFYTWNPELERVWRFFRFLQHEFGERDLAVPRDVATALKGDAGLLGQYRAINAFYGKLTNSQICLGADALIDSGEPVDALAKRLGVRRRTVAILPPGTSRETELFDRMFGERGVPPGTNLMTELIRRIRSGQVSLEPGKDDGWYQHQVFALETLLLPSKGEEANKLLLTANYKRRLVEAFKALITKRRETHARFVGVAKKAETARPLSGGEVRPRLRVEPCVTYYLRTARAYAFVQAFLTATIGSDRLASMQGLRQGGLRGPNLADELEALRLRSYGFYLVACEDIGLRPRLTEGELADPEAARAAALGWLGQIEKDPDLACDTRVSVPIFVDPDARQTRLWATLGVRLAPLEASYAKAPKVRPREQGGEWKVVEPYQLGAASLLIPVDEFAEIELAGLRVLTREELRAACDRRKTREAIVEELQSRGAEGGR